MIVAVNPILHDNKAHKHKVVSIASNLVALMWTWANFPVVLRIFNENTKNTALQLFFAVFFKIFKRKFAQDTMGNMRFTPNKITQHILCEKLYTSESEGITHITHKLSLTYKTTIVDSVVPQLHPIWSLSTQDCSFPVNSFLFYDNIPRLVHCREICNYPLFNRWLSWLKRLPSSTQVLWRKLVWLP